MAEVRPAGRLPSASRSVPGWWGVLAAASATAAGATAVVVTSGLAPESPVSASSPPLVLSWPGACLTALLVAVCWVVVTTRPPTAIGISLIALSWILPGLAAWSALGSWLRAALLAAPPFAPAGVAVLVASWRPGSGRRWPAGAMGFAIAGAAVHLLGYDPFFDPACARTCESSRTVLGPVLSAYEVAVLVAACVLAASVAATVGGAPTTRAPSALSISGVVASVGFAAAALSPVVRWGDPAGAPYVDGLQTFGVAVVAIAVVVELVREFRVRRSVRDLVRQLSVVGSPAASMRSVSSVDFAVPHDGRWVDASGRLVPAERNERAAVLSGVAGPAVRLVPSRWADPAQILASITPAERLALENARFKAAAQLRLVELRASRRRIVEITDRERQRIERDLHDGAQQRLVGVAMHLNSVGAATDPEATAMLAAAAGQVRDALSALRRLSHDSLASVLTAEGLLAAVEDLVAAAPLPVEVGATVEERVVPAPVQATAYMATSVALDNVVAHARSEEARIMIATDGGGLVLEVTDAGIGGATQGAGLTAVADRVGALGGTFQLLSTPGAGTTVRVVLPCG